MKTLREVLGLDLFDLLLHVALTACVIGVVAVSNGPEELLPVITGLSLLVLGVRRSIALRALERRGVGLSSGEMAAERIMELEQRMAELESAHARVAELEERLDFAERLLAQTAEQRALGSGGPR